MRTNIDLQDLLIRNLAEVLRQAIDLLGEIDDGIYVKAEKSACENGGAVGGHFRHCLEFVNCFLSGIENGRVDYNKRERNHQLEMNREYAVAEYAKTIQVLKNLSFSESGGALFVKSEDIESVEHYWCASSVERELDFLQSHTIHHYALIGFKLRAFGFELPAEFGVAPSTLRFWKQRKSAAG